MKKSTIIFVFIFSLFCYTGSAQAFNGILSDFNLRYPGSSSGASASCQLCHGQSTSTWNEYGWDLRQNNADFGVLENLPSINNNGGTTYLDEINADAQPGWTTGTNNNLYNSSGLISDAQTPPAGIGDLDPAVASQPPIADAGGDSDGFYFGTVGSPVTFDGSGSSAAGNIVSHNWDFGDGNTGTGVSPSHTYAAVGTYTVSLTVTDDVGETDTTTAMADIGSAPNVPPIADPNGPYTGTVGSSVTFDGSGSSDIDGTIVSYSWDFGDGNTNTGLTPSNSHTYATVGTYTVSLTVTDDGGATNTDTTTATIDPVVDDNIPPTADPNGPYTGIVGSAVTFDGSGSSDSDGTIASYSWNFGDGNTGTGVSPSHTYTAAGSYTVFLTVTDDGEATGTDTTTAIIDSIAGENVPPTADPNGPYAGIDGSPVTFNGSGSSDSDGSIISYDWDFGDGATGTGVTPSHTYATGGTYDVSLTVTDDGGATGTDTTTATIQNIITGQPSQPSQPDGDITAPEPMEKVEVKVLKTIKRKNRAVTAVKIELVEDDMDLRIADILCGPEGAPLIAPKRLIQKKDGEAIAIFRTNDLGIQYDGTQLVCTGTMGPEGTKFMGVSNQLTSGGDVNDERNEHVKDRHNDDDDNERPNNRDDDDEDSRQRHHRDDD